MMAQSVIYDSNVEGCDQQFDESLYHSGECYNYTNLKKKAEIVLENKGSQTAYELAQRINTEESTTRELLTRMQDEGIVLRDRQPFWLEDNWKIDEETALESLMD